MSDRETIKAIRRAERKLVREHRTAEQARGVAPDGVWRRQQVVDITEEDRILQVEPHAEGVKLTAARLNEPGRYTSKVSLLLSPEEAEHVAGLLHALAAAHREAGGHG